MPKFTRPTNPSANLEDREGRSPTVVEVAKLVECSIATVSRALNKPDSVRPELRRRILNAVNKLGYVPNGSARALRSSRSRLIGSMMPTLNSAIYSPMLEALQNRISSSGASLLHHVTGYDLDREFQQIRALVEKGVDGVVLVGTLHRQETLQLLRDRGIRFLVTYALSDGVSMPCVGFDNRKGGALAARYLLDLGHTSLAVIVGITKDNDRASDRLEGFLSAAKESGIARSAITVVESPYDFNSGRAAMRLVLERHPRATAVFCASDVLAVGAMRGCGDAGLSIPRDISVVGYDNLDIAEYLTPGLTTIEVPARLMGERVADYFLAERAAEGFHSRVEFETKLIVRGTAAPPSSNERVQVKALRRSRDKTSAQRS